MPDVTISKGASSITVPVENDAGDLVIAHDIGKPERETLSGAKEQKLVQRNGLTDPYPVDNLAGRQAFVLQFLLTGATAYADAKTLAEDIVREESTASSSITVDLSAVSGLSSYTVGVPSDEALTLDYDPEVGISDAVAVTLRVEVVESVL